MPLFIPSPSQGVWYIGGTIPIRGYALSILTGIIVAIIIAWRRWRAWGENTGQLENIALVSVIMGIIGARVYWIIIEWQRYFGPDGVWYRMFFVWEGGLGIWGGITFGFLTAWLMCRHYKIPFLRLADAVAPAFLIAQGIGRLGNYWNQELYGLPTALPWGLEIDLAHRVAGYEQYATFHPTFLYEMLWNFAGAAVLLLLERRLKLGRGKLFALYIIIYAVGRFFVESLRIDPVAVIAGLRVNSWATLIGGLFGVGLLVWLLRFRPGANEVVAKADDTATEAATTDEPADVPVEDATPEAAPEPEAAPDPDALPPRPVRRPTRPTPRPRTAPPAPAPEEPAPADDVPTTRVTSLAARAGRRPSS